MDKPENNPEAQDQRQNSAEDARVSSGSHDAESCTLFSPKNLDKQLLLDRILRTAVIGLIVFLLFMILVESVLSAVGSPTVIVSQLLVFVVFGLWFITVLINTRVVQQLPLIALKMADNPAEAEKHIAASLNRRPLQPWVRLSLYHQLAVVRHQQKRFDEAASICQTVLQYDLGPAENANRPVDVAIPASSTPSQVPPPSPVGRSNPVASTPLTAGARAHLLTILIDCRLQQGDLWTAYSALLALHACRLSMTEKLQLLLLQKRYEVLAGRDQAALLTIDKTIELAELMPALQCGVMHAILAISARRLNRSVLADWLEQRAVLLLTEKQRAEIW